MGEGGIEEGGEKELGMEGGRVRRRGREGAGDGGREG